MVPLSNRLLLVSDAYGKLRRDTNIKCQSIATNGAIWRRRPNWNGSKRENGPLHLSGSRNCMTECNFLFVQLQ